MREVLDECVSCPPELGCIGSACPYKNVVRYFCDECGEEGKLYHYEDEELCEECLLKRHKVVKGSECY